MPSSPGPNVKSLVRDTGERFHSFLPGHALCTRNNLRNLDSVEVFCYVNPRYIQPRFLFAGLFVSYVMSKVVGGVWRWIYNPDFGPLNQVLKAVALEAWTRPWLGDLQLALPAVGAVGTWVQYGFCMVLFIAGVQRIEEELYDAAKIDGADEFRQFWHVTLPGIRNEISVALVITFIAALRTFDLVFVTTRGGPGNETMVVSLWLYRNAFQINRPDMRQPSQRY